MHTDDSRDSGEETCVCGYNMTEEDETDDDETDEEAPGRFMVLASCGLPASRHSDRSDGLRRP